MAFEALAAPFPWFGGKRRVASQVWAALGDVEHYVEPFAGSLAVLLGRPTPPRVETVNDVDAYLCVAPDTRVLRSDLTWAQAGDIAIGDELLAFDEHNGATREGLRAPAHYRHWKLTHVTATQRIVKPCYRLTFDDSTSVVASADHLWLGGSHRSGGRGWRWQTTKGMVCNRATQCTWVLKLANVVECENAYDIGWLAGFFDGEGSIVGRPGLKIVVTQNAGQLFDRAEVLLKSFGFNVSRHERSGKAICFLTINGGMREQMRFLMLVRPSRLINNFHAIIEGASVYGREHQAVALVGKEYLGEQEVVAITTDSHTFIAEGLASHNCNFWRALQHDPDAVAEAADWPVNETDLTARHIWLVNEGRERLARLHGDPDWYDAKVAGWWVWGLCCWIGGGWCAGNGPWGAEDGKLVHVGGEGRGVIRGLPHLINPGRGVKRQLVHLGDSGRGVNRQLVHLGNAGQGVNRKRPHLGGQGGTGVGVHAAGRGDLYEYMRALAARLRRVRVCCGDWQRVVTSGALSHGREVGVFLDPPYDVNERDPGCYNSDAEYGHVSAAVREWCLENGDNPRYRIVLAGYDGEHDMPSSWRVLAWKATRAYGTHDGEDNGNRRRERLWFSPHCLVPGHTQTALPGLEGE